MTAYTNDKQTPCVCESLSPSLGGLKETLFEVWRVSGLVVAWLGRRTKKEMCK